jgi:hypothetical protein
MAEIYRRRAVVDYEEPIHQELPSGQGRGYTCIGKRRMRCEVELDLDVSEVLRVMGAKACRSKGGRCVDGHLTVKRAGTPVELSREVYS